MDKISRRSFIKFINRILAITGLAALTGPVIAFFYPPKLEEMPSEPVLIGTKDELGLGQSITVRFGRYPALVIHTPDGLRAYSAVCTHFACIVKWNPELGQIVCPCHEGYFDPMDGHVITGPPPTPLEALTVTLIEDEIFVGGEG